MSLIAFSHFIPSSHASHIMAGDLTYRFLGGMNYELTLKLYRDCNGVDLASTASVRLRSSCYRDTSATLTLLNGSGNILPLICPAQQSNSACLGGNLLGVKEYIYQDTISLPISCEDWRFSWTSCCRNAAISNLSNPYTHSFYLEAFLNHELSRGNSSPSFGSIPTPYICLGQPFAYTQGASEADGDSLVYTLVDPQTSAVGTIPFSTGYSASQPLSPSMTFSPQSGQIFFTPNIQQVAVVSLLVEEFRNDSLIGSTRRDIQIIVLNCNNTFPALSPPAAIHVQAPAVQSSSLALEICPGNILHFELQGSDFDLGDSVFIEAAGAMMPGVSLTPNPGLGSGAMQVEWMPTAGDIGTYVWEFLVRDNHCPLLGVQRYAVTIRVRDRTRAGPDLFYCPAGGPVRLGAEGGSAFVWTKINQTAFNPGEMSCDSCPHPLAAPPLTTTYVVTSNLGNCINKDTITVYVVPNITLATGALKDTICRSESVQLFSIPNAPNNITFGWNPTSSLLDANTLAPLAIPTQSTSYTIRVTSSAGCTVQDTVHIHVIDMDVTAFAPQDKVCRLDSAVQLFSVVNSNVPYSIRWHDPLGATLGQTDSIRFLGLFSGNYYITLEDSNQTCQAKDSIYIDVLDLVVLPGSNAICQGDSLVLQANYLGPTGLFYPTESGPTDSCCGPRNLYLVGDTCDSSGPAGGQACLQPGFQSTAYRASFEASRVQYLFRKAELHAADFLGGTIESIAFHVSWLLRQGSNTELDEVVIKLGYTHEDSLRDFMDGLTTVWGPAPFNPQLGFNEHMLDIPYAWTGASNLVIQICSVDSSNPLGIAFYETSVGTYPFPPTIKADRFTPQTPCELPPDTGLIYQRPTVRFGVCVEGLNPVYRWTPATGLSNPHIANPKASPASSTTYMLHLSIADSCICQLEKPALVTVDGCVLGDAFLTFDLEKKGNAARLSWQLSQAQMPATLWIEKAINGLFVAVGRGSGALAEVFEEEKLQAGEHIYRLHLVDEIGREAFSEVKSIHISLEDLHQMIYPNPVRKGQTLFVSSSGEKQALSIYDSMGKQLYHNTHFKGKTIATDAFQPGVYLVVLGGEVWKIAIQN